MLVRGALLALAIQPRQIFAGRRRDARGFRQPAQKLLLTRPRVPPHNRAHPRRQRRTPVLGRIEPRTLLLDKLVEALRLQQLIQTLIKRMPRSRRQLGVRDPDVLLLLPLLARAHRHAPILRTKSVDTPEVFVYESGLAPRAANVLVGYFTFMQNSSCSSQFRAGADMQ